MLTITYRLLSQSLNFTNEVAGDGGKQGRDNVLTEEIFLETSQLHNNQALAESNRNTLDSRRNVQFVETGGKVILDRMMGNLEWWAIFLFPRPDTRRFRTWPSRGDNCRPRDSRGTFHCWRRSSRLPEDDSDHHQRERPDRQKYRSIPSYNTLVSSVMA